MHSLLQRIPAADGECLQAVTGTVNGVPCIAERKCVQRYFFLIGRVSQHSNGLSPLWFLLSKACTNGSRLTVSIDWTGTENRLVPSKATAEQAFKVLC